MSIRITELDTHIAKRCVDFRMAAPGVNLAQLSRFLGVRYQSYQDYEKGAVSFRMSTVHKLATFYGVTVDEFIGEDAPPTIQNAEKLSFASTLISKLPQEAAAEVVRFASMKAREYGIK